MHVLPSSMALSQQVSGKLIFFCLQCLFNLKMRLAEKSDICLRLFFLCFPHTLSIPILMSSFQSNILLTYFPGCLAMIFLKTRCYFKKNSEIICQISVPHEYKIKYIGHHTRLRRFLMMMRQSRFAPRYLTASRHVHEVLAYPIRRFETVQELS